MSIIFTPSSLLTLPDPPSTPHPFPNFCLLLLFIFNNLPSPICIQFLYIGGGASSGAGQTPQGQTLKEN